MRYSKIITKSVFAILNIANLISQTFDEIENIAKCNIANFLKKWKYRKVVYCNYFENRCDIFLENIAKKKPMAKGRVEL